MLTSFRPDYTFLDGGAMPARQFGDFEIAEERAVHSASLSCAINNTGPLTRYMLDCLPRLNDLETRARASGMHVVIDSRVSMLMPGMYPAIPGWHCDGVPRPDKHAQPDFRLLNPAAINYIASISTDANGVSNTEFVADHIACDISPDEPVWRQVHRAVEDIKPRTDFMPDGVWTSFGPYAIHRATPAKVRGWRIWVRVSLYHKPPHNIRARHSQVYLLSEENGW